MKYFGQKNANAGLSKYEEMRCWIGWLELIRISMSWTNIAIERLGLGDEEMKMQLNYIVYNVTLHLTKAKGQ